MRQKLPKSRFCAMRLKKIALLHCNSLPKFSSLVQISHQIAQINKFKSPKIEIQSTQARFKILKFARAHRVGVAVWRGGRASQNVAMWVGSCVGERKIVWRVRVGRAFDVGE